MEKSIMNRIAKILEAGKNAAKTRMGAAYIEDIQIYNGYCEPGYDSDQVVALGNWNDITEYNGNERNVLDDTPCRVSDLLGKIDVEIEWSDEWTSCHECYKIFRTSPDSYSWKRSGDTDENGCICENCISQDPEGYLIGLEGRDGYCNTMDTIDPSECGYLRLDFDFENGFHPGQHDNPQEIGRLLRKAGIDRYLFDLETQNQFDIQFAVYIHGTQAHLVEKAMVLFDK